MANRRRQGRLRRLTQAEREQRAKRAARRNRDGKLRKKFMLAKDEPLNRVQREQRS